MYQKELKDRKGRMAVEIVDDHEFRRFIEKRGRRLLGVVRHLAGDQAKPQKLVRPLLGELLSQATQIEELLDAYDARNNRRWSQFRSMVAAVKLFADLGYELLHIRHSLPWYHLLPIEYDFVQATDETLEFMREALFTAAKHLVAEADQVGLTSAANPKQEDIYTEWLPNGRLQRDRMTYRTETVRETVTLLATAFLNLAAENRELCSDAQSWSSDRPYEIPDSLSEKNLRRAKFEFHSMQAMYDTYVSDTETEDMDPGLSVLRGHISVVFHLLQTATLLAHHYERHMTGQFSDASICPEPLVKPEKLLSILMNYSVICSSRYIECAQRLCQEMLMRYAKIGRVKVPVPQYRGFHVRPATLVSKLVLHYGSEVAMELEGDEYDAGAALDLFRANEKINAQKRHWLVEQVLDLGVVGAEADSKSVMDVVRDVVTKLAEQNKLIIYEQPLELPKAPGEEGGILLEQVTAELATLHAMGKIDVASNLQVTFRGDMRVLEDIRLLAAAGYGEDSLGNNIALPPELKYLRR